MSHIISKGNQNGLKDKPAIIDETEAREDKITQGKVVIETTVLLKQADHARIKKICEILDISFAEYTEKALEGALDGDLNDWDYLGENFAAYLQRIKNIKQ